MATKKAPKRTLAKDGPRPVDVHVGRRIRLRRTLLGLTQEKLGDGVGLTFQQIQKYERGTNRVGCSRLWEFCNILNVPPSFFFDDMPDDIKNANPDAKVPASIEPDPLARRETLELVRAYYRIIDPKVRKQMFELVKSIGKGEGGGEGEGSTAAA